MVCVLFSRPDDDVTLNYLYYFSKELVNLSKSKHYKTINKKRKEANKLIITSIIKKQKPRLIMFNGHGSPKEITGYKQEVIVSADKNPQLLNKTITYSLSCSSALILGPKVVEKGAICFIGYELDFALGKDPDSEASPKHDKIAKLFLEPSNSLFSSLLLGKKVKVAIDKAKKEMMDNVWYLNTTKSFPDAVHYAPFLFSNYLGLVAHGNVNASIN